MNRGLTLRDVEKQTGVSIRSISEYERAIVEPCVTTAIKLARFYGSSVENLFS